MSTVEMLIAVSGLAVLAVLGHWIRETVHQPHRRKRQAEVYSFFLDAWANFLHLPNLHDLEANAPDDIRELVADIRATLHAAERQLQLHGGRRVLRAYRTFQTAHADGEATPQHVNDLIVEMRRDLGLSAYSESRTKPLGIDINAIEQPRMWQASPASPVQDGERPGGDGSACSDDSMRSPQSNAIASSIRQSYK